MQAQHHLACPISTRGLECSLTEAAIAKPDMQWKALAGKCGIRAGSCMAASGCAAEESDYHTIWHIVRYWCCAGKAKREQGS